MLVAGVKCRMEVLKSVSKALRYRLGKTHKVLLHVDKRDVVLGEKLTNTICIGGLVTRNLVAVQLRRQTSNIESNRGEFARGLRKGNAHKGEG